ncbi:MAG: flagellar hook-associated protein FlgK [Veillonellales bacterium]
MSSTFNTYNIATTGMYVSQASLSVVSNNLANISTTGYSRQKAVSEEKTVSTGVDTSYGTGVGLEEISRARDVFLDQTYRQEKAQTEYYNTKNNLLEDAQKLLNEYGSSSSSTNSENGLQQTVTDFFDGWEQLTKDPGSQSTRKSVLEYADALVTTFNEVNTQLTEMQQDAGSRVKDGVDSLNKLAKQVVALNQKISRAEANGNEDCNLRDQRDELLDQMSSLANITVNEQSDGSLNVSIGGVSLVQGNSTHTLGTVEDGSTIQVVWSDLGSTAAISSGSIKANMEEADQSAFTAISGSASYDFTADGNSSLASLRQGLNDLVTTIANKVNTLLASGKDLDGNTGAALFVAADDNKPLELGNIEVNSVITADVDKLAAGTTGETDDATIATEINALKTNKIFSSDGLSMNVTSFYQAVVSWISTAGNTASSNYDTQNTLLQQAESQRQSISSVSQDEEMSNMIVYQNAYNASARLLSTIDYLLGDLIDKLGS